MLEIKEISKRYNKKIALNKISMRLDYGVYGLLGPNGAGKSTLMNILTDNLKEDSGEILYKGKNVKVLKEKFLSKIGFAPQMQGLYEEFTGVRFLAYMGTLKGIKKKELEAEVYRVLKKVNLLDKGNEKLSSYSGGMRQRILIAQAIMGNPEILVMDEVSAGLDPKERVRIRGLMGEMSKDKIILIATHVVSDIESIAKEIIIIKKGEVVEKDTCMNLVKKYAKENYDLEEVYMRIFGEDI